MKVLVAENNSHNMMQLCDLLEKEGYATLQALTGQDALKLYDQNKPDFICLDIGLDDMSGYDVCRDIRKINPQVPIVFISAKTNPVDKVIGLELGADDYITKPFDIYEVTARIRAIARRCLVQAAPQAKDDLFIMADVTIYPQQLKGERDGQMFDLSLREIKILQLFKKNEGRLVTRDQLLDHCWGSHIMPESRTIDWHISKLRRKVEKDYMNPEIITTAHGAGYKFETAKT